MYAIKMIRSKNWWTSRNTPPGHIWVSENLDEYTTKKNAMKWRTKEEAENEISEPWEIIVKI